MSDLSTGLIVAIATMAGGIIGFLINYILKTKDIDFKQYSEQLSAITKKLEVLVLDFTKFNITIMEEAKTWSWNTQRITDIENDLRELTREVQNLRASISELAIKHEHHLDNDRKRHEND